MEFFTHIDIAPSADQVDHRQRLMLLGSCFSDSMGARLARDKFQVMANPFGTLYNPASIAAQLLRCVSEEEFPSNHGAFLRDERSGRWLSWLHHGSVWGATADELAAEVNRRMHQAAQWLRQADWLMLTFGSAYVFQLAESGLVVANCHKQDGRRFLHKRLSAWEIEDMWVPVVQLLRSVNPRLKFLFTVSPIRHKGDGLHQNQLSKSELLLATDALCAKMGDCCRYFPAYELLLDELRDYRFYGPDLLHPSQQAEDYVYERFCQAFVSEEERRLSERCRAVNSALNHRPTDEQSAEYQAFLKKTLNQIEELKGDCPCLDFDAEEKLCNTKLRK